MGGPGGTPPTIWGTPLGHPPGPLGPPGTPKLISRAPFPETPPGGPPGTEFCTFRGVFNKSPIRDKHGTRNFSVFGTKIRDFFGLDTNRTVFAHLLDWVYRQGVRTVPEGKKSQNPGGEIFRIFCPPARARPARTRFLGPPGPPLGYPMTPKKPPFWTLFGPFSGPPRTPFLDPLGLPPMDPPLNPTGQGEPRSPCTPSRGRRFNGMRSCRSFAACSTHPIEPETTSQDVATWEQHPRRSLERHRARTLVEACDAAR